MLPAWVLVVVLWTNMPSDSNYEHPAVTSFTIPFATETLCNKAQAHFQEHLADGRIPSDTHCVKTGY
jgi:hypothetical protein